MITYCFHDWSLGRLLLCSDGHRLTTVHFVDGGRDRVVVGEDWTLEPAAAPFDRARAQLDAYADGRLQAFDLPLGPQGTSFQRQVWTAIAGVPFGRTITYAALAAEVGRPTASRAVGSITGQNPLAVIVPCHRIVGTNGALTGYAGGLPRKERLLAFEAAVARAAVVAALTSSRDLLDL